MVGIQALRSKALFPDAWKWKTLPEGETSVASGNGEYGTITEGACAEYTCYANSKMECIDFTCEVFERLFGPAAKVLHSGAEVREDKMTTRVPKERKFDYTKFEMKVVLGSGSFGTVVLAEYKEAESERYALKLLSKCDVMETGQLRHVLDERKLLSKMDSPFILKMSGTYQTPHRLVFVTEVLECGDLWSIIYEVPEHYDERGLSRDVASFSI